MAGNIISLPNLGDSDWSNFVTIVEKTNRGYIGISLSNIDNDNEPKIEDGSVVEVNGAIFQFTTAETITGWPSAGGTSTYIVVVPSGSTATVVFTASAPTWSGTKNGWYDGNDRYIGGLEWEGSATYAQKFIYQRINDGNNDNFLVTGEGGIRAESGGVFLKTKVLEIGDWNMYPTLGGVTNVDVAHGLTFTNIRAISGMIRNDVNTVYIPFGRAAGADSGLSTVWITSATATSINIRRLTGVDPCDSAGYDSTSYNRGWLVIKYV